MQKSALELSLVCALYIMTSIPHWNPRLPRLCCSFLPILSCTRVIVGCVVECLVATVIRGQNIILSGVTRALATWSELWVWCPSSYQHQKCRLLKKKGEKCCLLQRREKHVTRGGPPSLSLVRLLIILAAFLYFVDSTFTPTCSLLLSFLILSISKCFQRYSHTVQLLITLFKQFEKHLAELVIKAC